MTSSKGHGSSDRLGSAGLRRAFTRILRQPTAALPKTQAARGNGLSQTQLEMVRARASGQTRKQIAHSLGLSLKTIEYHFLRIYRLLRISDDIELTHYAIRNGLIEVKAFGLPQFKDLEP